MNTLRQVKGDIADSEWPNVAARLQQRIDAAMKHRGR